MSLNAFPAVSRSFINSFTGTRKFVDITNGSNANSGDTEATAYQTLAYAQSQTSTINTAVMYVINPGTYNLTAVEVSAYANAGFSDSNLPRTFFCAPNGQTVFQWTAGSQRDAAMVSLQNNGSAVYGAVLKRNNNGRSANYEVAMFNNGTAHCQGDFYNCVFLETNPNGNWSLQYDNSASAQSTVNHCTFYTIENGANDYTGGAGLVFNNCAFNYNYGAGSATKNNTVVNQTIDAEDYELAAENTTYGVYSGTYAWGQALGPIVEYLVVGGGGGGGAGGGGGGGGGVLTGTITAFDATNYTVTVGTGGAGGPLNVPNGATKGNDSVFSNQTALGGGPGGGTPNSGGSGGGGGYGYNLTGGLGTVGQGNNGGNGIQGGNYGGGGGGGAGGAGQNAPSLGGTGGLGFTSSISGSAVDYGGGGGGGTGGTGSGGGGNGGFGDSTQGTEGAINRGGGGGGGGNASTFAVGSNGGSGVVILKYPDTLTIINADGGLVFTTSTAVSGYRSTTFTEGTGSIQFLETPPTTVSVEYLVVAGGGGGGGGNYHGAGGGGGGVRTGTSDLVKSTNYTVTVGIGGTNPPNARGGNGNNSVFRNAIAIGGGGGGNYNVGNGLNGGSGGGAPFNYTFGLGTGGQGNNGGSGSSADPNYGQGGGGGAGAVGGSGTGTTGGNGGAGVSSSISGSSVFYGGGGGGSTYVGGTPGSGGLGGGGAGSFGNATSGQDNTGGGGGGGERNGTTGGAGGSGVVILKHPLDSVFTASQGLIFTTVAVSGYNITTFTEGTGTVQLEDSIPGLYAPASVQRGESFDVTLLTENVADNTTIAYTITGVTSADLSGDPLTGNFTIVNNIDTITIQTADIPLMRTMTLSANNLSVQVFLDGAKSVNADLLIVAGGGAGGNRNTTNANGGGGAGGLLHATGLSIANGIYTVLVGAGGTRVANATAGIGNRGGNSSFSDYVAQGGGGGGSTGVAFDADKMNGGSGGGNAQGQTGGGAATQTSIGTATGYGNAGGTSSVQWTGAGGGGAQSAGVNGSSSAPGGNGGAGLSFDISGTTKFYAGGGGGSGNSSQRAGDGFHGGGRGAGTTSHYAHTSYPANTINATTLGSATPDAVVNTGGGGGGGSYWASNGGWSLGSGQGGSGVVIIRYAGAQRATGGAVTTVDGYTVHTFATSGSFEFPPPPQYASGLNVESSVYTGDSIEIVYVDQTQADNTTVPYTITGVASADIDGESLTGNFTVIGGIANLTLTATNITNKTLTLTANNQSVDVSLQYAVNIRYLAVAGGGGGGTDMGGGGGAGGLLGFSGQLVTPGSYNIVIGAGGQGAPQTVTNASPSGSNGTNTTFDALVAIGGGGGASNHSNTISNAGNGGSGGGGSGGRMSSASYGGLPGNGTVGQGNNGAGSGFQWYPGGGGGAGAAASQTGSQQANGGIGVENDILGTAYYWAGGGAGAGYTIFGGNGGLGGGGGGAPRQGAGTTNGTGGGSALNTGEVAEIGTKGAQTNKRGGNAGANTGSGGGGGSHYAGNNQGGNGGSGIVVIRYSGPQKALGGTITTVSTDTVHTFTTSGTFTVLDGEGLTPSTASAYFGETFDIFFGADEPDNTTIPYTITGVTSQQISNASLTGNFTINAGIASITINLAVQSTNTAATFTINAGAYSSTVSLSNLVSFSSNVPGTFWGGTIIFTAQTRGLTNGGTVPYTITGVTSAQISNASLTDNAANVLTSGLDGTATFTVVTNSTEPVLNSATMVTGITGASLTNVIRTGSPRLSESYKSSISSLLFIDTEVTDVHFEDLEARVNAVTNINSQLAVSQLKLSPSTTLFIDTEITDVHAPGLEATVFALDDINSPLIVSKFNSGLAGFIAAPTFVTDVHAPGLEATVFALDNINSPLVVSKFNSGLAGFVAAPTFAYSSGEDVKVSATASQTWYI